MRKWPEKNLYVIWQDLLQIIYDEVEAGNGHYIFHSYTDFERRFTQWALVSLERRSKKVKEQLTGSI